MKPTNDDTIFASTFRRLLPLLVVVALTGMFIACTRDVPETDQTAAPTNTPAATAAPQQTQSPEPADTPAPTVSPKPTASPPPTATARAVQSSKTRDETTDASQEEFAELADGNRAFAFDLYRTLAEEDGNLFCSPYSISLALAMTYSGARGETERQMADTLQFTLPQGELHSAFNAWTPISHLAEKRATIGSR